MKNRRKINFRYWHLPLAGNVMVEKTKLRNVVVNLQLQVGNLVSGELS